MRILHVLDHSLPIQSGYAFRTQKILEYQNKMGIETMQVTGIRHEASGLAEMVENFKFYRTLNTRQWATNLPILKQYFTIQLLRNSVKKLVEEYKPSLLHVHSPVLNGLAVLPVARMYNLPIVYEIRAFWEDAAIDHGTHTAFGPRYRLIRAVESWFAKRVNHITTISEGLKTELLTRGFKTQHISVVPNSVDMRLFHKDAINNALLEQYQNDLKLKGKFVVGFIGSFYHYEGLDLLIEACAKIKDNAPNLKVILVGGGPEENKLKAKIAEHQLIDTIFLLGRKNHHEIPTLYALLNACVYPRKKMRLTDLVTPLKPLEAMAQEVLVLASDVGGHRELIKQNETGVLFEANSVDSLAKCLLHCIHQSKPLEILFKAKNYILENRSWSHTTNLYQNIYAKALSA